MWNWITELSIKIRFVFLLNIFSHNIKLKLYIVWYFPFVKMTSNLGTMIYRNNKWFLQMIHRKRIFLTRICYPYIILNNLKILNQWIHLINWDERIVENATQRFRMISKQNRRWTLLMRIWSDQHKILQI